MTWAIEERRYSQRRTCALVGMHPRTYRYASQRPDDAGVRQRLRELANERRRFGYRRLHILLKREGIALNHKKLFRLYREERLTVRRRGGRKRALGTRAGAARGQHQLRPAARESVRRRPPHAARAAGDHHDQIPHVVHRQLLALRHHERRRRACARPSATPASAAIPSTA